MTQPLVFALPHALLFWPVLLWAMIPEARLYRAAVRSGAAASAVDQGTCRMVVMGARVAAIAALAAAVFLTGATITTARSAAFVAGTALLAAGAVLRRHCFRALGERFTYALDVRADQPIIETGAYRYVRHPSYTAGMLSAAGIGLALTNWASLAIMLLVTASIYAVRVRTEERALLGMLGERYRAYMQRTWRFVPGLY